MNDLTSKCPLCSGDGYIEMGDRYREGFAPEAWARDCDCSVHPSRDMYDWQTTMREAIARNEMNVLARLVDEHGGDMDSIYGAWTDWTQKNPS
jgi:hypothetical protein